MVNTTFEEGSQDLI